MAKKDLAVQQSLGDIRGKPFSRAVIDRFVFEQVRPIYLAHGNLNVQFDTPQARFTGDPSKPLPSSVKAVIGIRPGPVFKWAGATWSGNTAFSVAELDAFTGMKSGDAADGMKFEAGCQAILEAYGKKGYLDAALDKSPALDAAASRASFRVTITEGPQYHMGALALSGLSLEGERRILAAWKISKWRRFSMPAISIRSWMAGLVRLLAIFLGATKKSVTTCRKIQRPLPLMCLWTFNSAAALYWNSWATSSQVLPLARLLAPRRP